MNLNRTHSGQAEGLFLAESDSAVPAAALLLDLDGTLVDTLGDFTAALNAMLAELGLPATTPEAVALRIGKGAEQLVGSTLEAALAQDRQARSGKEYGPHRFAVALASYQRNYAAVNGRQARVYPGVLAGLQALQAAALPMACVTNKPTAFARRLLQAAGLAGFFELVAGGDAGIPKKPHPELLLRACAALGQAPGQVWMVGDSSNDVLAARAAGCGVLLVPYGYNHGLPATSAGADGIVANLTQVLPWLRMHRRIA